MKKNILMILIPVVLGIIAGCGEESSSAEEPTCAGLEPVIEFNKGPAVTPDSSKATIHFTTTGEVENVDIYPWMDIHGHGAAMKQSSLDKLETTSSEKYSFVLSDFYLTMPGDWQMKVELELDGADCQKSINFAVE